jgi:hypothetical protein
MDSEIMKLIFLFLSSMLAAGVFAEETLQIMKPLDIRRVTIEENGEWDPKLSSQNVPREACEDFILTDEDVKDFFKVARIVSEREYRHTLDVSRCYARGKAVLNNGETADWFIDRFRRGSLGVSQATYYYCGKCDSVKYYEACDLDCINSLQ